MAPPQHVKIISGTASMGLLLMGLRNVFAPHTHTRLATPRRGVYFGLFGLTDDDDPVLSEFFWGTSNTEELVPGQRALSKVMGIRNITLALIKLTILFGGGAAASTTTTSHHQEGSFLRRDLFAVIGGCQVLGACILLGDGKSQVAAKNAGASFLPTCCVIATEGLVLLYDAFFRDRPVKKH